MLYHICQPLSTAVYILCIPCLSTTVNSCLHNPVPSLSTSHARKGLYPTYLDFPVSIEQSLIFSFTTVTLPLSPSSPLLSISVMHFSTTAGISVFCAFTSVVRSTPNILFTYFMSGMQSLGTFSEHFLWALKPQSENQTR